MTKIEALGATAVFALLGTVALGLMESPAAVATFFVSLAAVAGLCME